MTPETMTLGVGQKQAIFATAFDQRGNLIPSAKFTFWSSDTLIAQVRKDGTVLGVTPGLAKIEARSQGRRASLAVLITGQSSRRPRPSGIVPDPRSGRRQPVPRRERTGHPPGHYGPMGGPRPGGGGWIWDIAQSRGCHRRYQWRGHRGRARRPRP